jgi:RNA polymerase sigma factor (sigma-70 family)
MNEVMAIAMGDSGELSLSGVLGFKPKDRTAGIPPECPEKLEERATHDTVVFNEDYLARLRRGDHHTARHFNRYFRAMLRFSLWHRFDGERAADLIDQVMVAAIERILKGEPKDATRLVAYVRGICSNLTKKEMRGRPLIMRMDLNLDLFADSAPRADHKLLEQERAEAVRKVLETLGKRDRAILVDLFWEEMTREEVCEKYKLSRERLRMILFHARRRFEKRWEPLKDSSEN